MKILSVHRNFIIINQVIIATIFNFFINIFIAWFLYRKFDQIPLWGTSSIALDNILTAFILTLLSYYYIVLSIWFSTKMKWLPVVANYPKVGIIAQMIRLPILIQGIVFAILATVLIALPVDVFFFLSRTQSMEYESFFWYKALYGAILSLIVSPPIGLLALLDFSRRRNLVQ